MEGSNPLWSRGAPRSTSDETPASCAASANRRWRAVARKPVVLAAAGALLLAAGMLCLVLPLALGLDRGARHESADVPAAADVDAPLPDEAPADSSAGRLAECRTTLRDPEQYTAAALAAEEVLFGGAAGGLPSGDASGAAAVVAALAALPRLQVPLVFWVLHSDAHPYSERFAAAATTQVALLNAAFLRSGIQFSLAALIPVAASNEAVEGCAAPSSAVDRLLPSTDRAISVVLCVPEGVWGQTAMLEGPLESGGAAGAQRILLRRAALWQSRTSLVHQMGHFLGLAHPFPDGSHGRGSCEEGGADGDGIPDTPRQYAPNSGCSLDGGMHVCPGEDGPLPVNNVMDHTNDTCRWLFTPGQLARMRAMTQAYRPQLYESAVQGYALRPLPFARAFQTGLPPLAVLRAQQAAALTAAANSSATAGGGDSSSSSSSNWDDEAAANLSMQLNELADSFGQAALAAASGSGPQLPTAAHRCSCLGPDARGRTAWVGELAEAGAVDALRVLWRAAPSAEPPGDGSSSCGGAADVGAGLLCASRQQQAEPPLVDIRVGYSPDPQQNARCTSAPVPLASPLQQVECETPLEGHFVSLEVVSSPPGSGTEPAASSQAAAAGAAPCLCAVQPLSCLSGPLPAGDVLAAAGVLGPVLLPGKWWQAQQSSSARAASSALRLPLAAGAAAGAAAGLEEFGAPSCSSTGAEEQPWWALETGLDAIAVRGLRLSLPSACPAAATSPDAAAVAAACAASGAGSGGGSGSSSRNNRTCSAFRGEGRGGTLGLAESLCRSPQPVNLTVLVGSSLEELSGLAADALAGAADRVCAANATLLPGQLADVDCGRLLHGSVVLVRAHLTAPAALELCGVEVLGAVELPLREALQGGGEEVEPASLRPYFALPLDGDEATCLSTSAQASSWTLPLQGLYTVLGLHVTATGSNATASLLDAGGVPLWSAQLRGVPASGAAQPVDLQVPASVGPAAAVALHNFSSLCEARLFVTSTTGGSSRPILPRSSPMAPPIALASDLAAAEASPGSGSDSGDSSAAAAWWALSASGHDFGAAVDGNYRTCAGSAAGEQPWAVASLGGAFRVEAVTLVADRDQLNLTLHTLPPGSLAPFLSALGLPRQPANGSAEEAAAGDSPAAPAGDVGLAPAAGEAAEAGVAAPAPAEEGSGPALELASALELAGAQLCAAGVAVERWAATQVWCQGPLVAEGLVVVRRVDSGGGGSSPGAAGLRLCEVGLLGRAAAAP